MINTQTFDSYPEFGNNSTKVAPDSAKYAAGFLQCDVLPAEWMNWAWAHNTKGITDLNTGLRMVEQELNAILTAGGAIPDGTSSQVIDAIKYVIQTKTGTISDLQTTNKSNIVAAVNEILSEVNSHIGDTNNPHGVTKAQVGLGNVANLSAQSIFDMVHPVGDKYIQYPGDDTPATLYNRNGITSTWEDISAHFAGLSIRFAGGQAEEFDKTLVISAKSGNQVTFTEEHGLTLGSLIVNKTTYTQYTIASIDSTTAVTLNETPVDLLNNTNVLILQNSGLPEITGSLRSPGPTGTMGAFENKNSYYDHGGGGWVDYMVDFKASKSNKIYGASTEVQTPNATAKLWKRIN